MKIVADENIPLLSDLFGSFGNPHPVPGSDIGPEMLLDADVLLVRSVTRVDERLLADSRVQFVGTATAGTDHVDLAYLRARGIAFAYAPASNAASVADYVTAALLDLADRDAIDLQGRVLGIVGVGAIGSRVLARATALGMQVVLNDPPRVEGDSQLRESGQAGAPFVELETLLTKADVVSLHVPLTVSGRHRTLKLIGPEALRKMKPRAWLINTARGEVVCGEALLADLRHNGRRRVVLDVWEGEPRPNVELAKLVTLGTPHIAGYAWDGKVRGAFLVARALADYFACPVPAEDVLLPEVVPEEAAREILADAGEADQSRMAALVRFMYDIRSDSERFRELTSLSHDERARQFKALRGGYPKRREFSSFEFAFPSGIAADFVSRLQEVFGANQVS